MHAERLLALYDRVADAPDAIPRLRRFVLDLAVRGRLVEQDSGDEPASELLERIAVEKARLVESGSIRKPRDLATGEELCPPFDIPAAWQWCRLDSVGAIIGGGTPAASEPDNFAERGDGVPWLTPADLGGYSDLYIDRGARDLTEKGLKSSSATVMPSGSVLFTSRAPIGYVAITANPIATNQGFKSIIPYVVDCARFVALTLRAFAPEINTHAPGTTFKEVSGKIVAGIPFPLPPLAEQHRIVAKVDELTALLDKLEATRDLRRAARDRLTAASFARLTAPDTRPEEFSVHAGFAINALPEFSVRPDQIKSLRQTILNLAVRGKLVEQDAGDEPLRNVRGGTLDEMEKPFELPFGWQWTRLCDLGRLSGGGTPSKSRPDYWEGDIPWVSPKDMKVDYIGDAKLHITEAAIVNSAAKLIEPQSVLFVVRGMILAHSFPVAVSRVPIAINQDMKAVTLTAPEMSEYVLRALMGLKSEMLARVKRSSHGTCRIESSEYGEFLIPLPPLAEQHRIVAKVDVLMTLCDRLETALTTEDTTRQRLLESLLREALTEEARSKDVA